ncbi:MAG: hypothetical protein KKE86_05735 [Planctomycetes bacterium]|nr:hypothetical protein [Planctomycetota bacterium]MBU4398823.1 hypothetical protein [Planctomycetota bacterium]MCG2683990.1 hypothetical protein [Planctomycetales bacterium]
MSPLYRHLCWSGLLIVLSGPVSGCGAENAPPRQDEAQKRTVTLSLGGTPSPGQPTVRVDADCDSATLPWFSWDTEGGDRAKNNLLRAGLSLKKRSHGQLVNLTGKGKKSGTQQVKFEMVGSQEPIAWTVGMEGDRLTMQFSGGAAGHDADRLELVFPFEPRMAATTLLPARWETDGSLRLPAVISAPDFGQMLLACSPCKNVRGWLRGSRANCTVEFTLELPMPRPGQAITLTMQPLRLPEPAGMQDKSLWRLARRGWFNAFQASAVWGDQSVSFSAPPGILANNVISDPVSCLLHLWADQAFLTPQFSPDIHPMNMVRRTLDWWLDHRVRPTGEVFAYWDHADMLDANASPLIAAWDYVEATGDRAWLAQRIERLELIADYMIRRDVDDDGIVESTHSGNYGTLKDPMRADSAYDTINAGHKNAYLNALVYRAFKCLADLEKQLQRNQQQARYSQRAQRLKAAYLKTFENPATGWLAWWRSKDGELHDLSSPMISSLAICYGLVEPARGHEMLKRLWTKIEAVGFRRFELGVPIALTPVRRGDYLMGLPPGVCGVPSREDGSDTFGQYLNGGCLVSDAVYFITALHIVGESKKADRILRAMLQRQEKGVFPNGGGFQNGVVNSYPGGAEFYTWDGKTCGYEGHLTYSYSFLQAVLLRQPSFRERLFRPLRE